MLVLVTIVSNYLSNVREFWDDDPNRGVAVVADDVFGDHVKSVVYLPDQNWGPKDTLWFDSITQGSDLLPYDFFLALEQPNSPQLFRSNENMNNRYRYLPRVPTSSNPDGLPVGFAKDDYKGRDFIGFTCAACHTGQINFNGVGIRIDGAPAMADMDSLLTDLAAALRATSSKPDVRARFVQNVLPLGHYKSEAEITADLAKYAQRITTYRVVNHTDVPYGFARLDAFGRIYNQVLQYLITVPDIKQALSELVDEKRIGKDALSQGDFDRIMKKLDDKKVLDGDDRDQIIASIAGSLSLKQQLYFRNKIFNTPNAPVSYPFLWDIPQHDYVQWNGLGANAGLGPVGRNTGEVIGVFGTMDWSQGDHWTLAALLDGQGFTSRPIDFKSSVNVHNLALIENHLNTLHSPVWPQNILPKLDMAKVARGEHLFDQYCSQCHAEIDRTSSSRRVVAFMSGLDRIKTDPKMASNGATYDGYSGILRNQYVDAGPGSLLIGQKAPVAELLTKATLSVVATPDATKWWGRRFVEWAYDLIFALRNNDIKASLKRGDYAPDTTVNPYNSLLAYKGRSLNGIWATAPYLHNGSVPTLYDLLLPASAMPGDPPGMEYRPVTFMVGSREFDPVKVGFKTSGYNGFLFKTGNKMADGTIQPIPGNSNSGHEYGTRDEALPDGSVLPALTQDERWDLVEYLKSL